MSTAGLAALSAPLERTSPTAEIARRIVAQVSGGHLKPGARLPSERQLAESLGTGRSSIREAIAALDLLGILEVRPGAGTFIREATSELLPESIEWGLMLGQQRTLDLVEARRYIETVLASLAAERATPTGVAKLRLCFDRMEQNVRRPEKFVKADVAFHLQLATMADNSILSDILRSIRALLEVWIRRAVDGEDDLYPTLDEHRGVLHAVEAHDPAAAEEAMRAHMDSAGHRLNVSLGS